jgi:hypothetical protein
MIQRIQTFYLLLAFICNGVLPYMFPLWKTMDANGKMAPHYFMQNMEFVFLLSLSNALILVSILSFKKRMQQFLLGRINLVINLILLGLFVYHSLTLSGGANSAPEKGIGLILPVFSIVFLVLANKAIKKDDELVKSVDRLR